MNKEFNEYKYAKKVLCRLVCQFYDYELTKENADKLGINYIDDNIFNSLNYVSCVYHGFNPQGLYIWEKLGIDKPIITMSQIWDKLEMINDEKFDETRDYYRELLELKLIDIYMIKEYYKTFVDKEYADNLNIDYDEELDEYDDKIDGCDHLFEGAGECAWDLLGFDKNFVALSNVINVKKDLEEKILIKTLKKD